MKSTNYRRSAAEGFSLVEEQNQNGQTIARFCHFYKMVKPSNVNPSERLQSTLVQIPTTKLPEVHPPGAWLQAAGLSQCKGSWWVFAGAAGLVGGIR